MEEGSGDDYLRAIETRFVALRGRGFALTAKDVGRALSWQADGVPLRVVMSVLEEAMRRWRADGARRAPTLGGLERSIEAAMKRRAERSVVKADVTVDEGAVWGALARAIEACGHAQGDPHVRVALRKAWGALQAAKARGDDPWTLAREVDDALVEGLHDLLDASERDTIAGQSVAEAQRSGPNMSREARDERVLLERARLVRARFEVPELLAAILDSDVQVSR